MLMLAVSTVNSGFHLAALCVYGNLTISLSRVPVTAAGKKARCFIGMLRGRH